MSFFRFDQDNVFYDTILKIHPVWILYQLLCISVLVLTIVMNRHVSILHVLVSTIDMPIWLEVFSNLFTSRQNNNGSHLYLQHTIG